jgi:hypothetical protein
MEHLFVRNFSHRLLLDIIKGPVRRLSITRRLDRACILSVFKVQAGGRKMA